jgi:hypothetical protein
VLSVENTSFLGLFGADVEVSWEGDASGSAEVGSGEDAVLVEPSDSQRTLAFDLRPDGDAYWTLRVEKLT